MIYRHWSRKLSLQTIRLPSASNPCPHPASSNVHPICRFPEKLCKWQLSDLLKRNEILLVESLISSVGLNVGSPGQWCSRRWLSHVRALSRLGAVPVQFGVSRRPRVVLVVVRSRSQRSHLLKREFSMQEMNAIYWSCPQLFIKITRI